MTIHAIHTVRDGGRVIRTIRDGRDYRALLELVRAGKIETTTPEMGSRVHCAAIVDWEGGRYVVKKGSRPYSGFAARLKRRIFGSPFFAGMKKVEVAVADGCDRVQRIFLVEETVERDRASGTTCVTAWLVLEYLPGEVLFRHRDMDELKRKIPGAVREIHRYGLTQTDCNPTNFLIAPDGRIKIIDLYFTSSPFFWSMFRTVDKIKKHYGLDVPVDGIVNKAAFALAKTIYYAAERIRVLLNKERRR